MRVWDVMNEAVFEEDPPRDLSLMGADHEADSFLLNIDGVFDTTGLVRTGVPYIGDSCFALIY